MKLSRSVIFCGLILTTILQANAQGLTVTRVNHFENPEHRDNIGNWARGDTIYVEGTYTTETVNNVSLKLITFARGTWTDPIGLHTVTVDDTVPFSGVIDIFMVIPDDYLLYVDAGDSANTQLLQISVYYDSIDRSFSNFYLYVVEQTTEPEGSLIDFDAVYGPATGASLVSKINSAVASADPGDTILFRSAEYDFGGNTLSIQKGICLSGQLPDSINLNSIGAYDVETTFKDLKQFQVRSSDVQIANLKLKPYSGIGYVFARVSHSSYGGSNLEEFYTNIRMSNVIFEDGRVQCYGGNGAGITFRNVSFLNYSQGGYYTNRKGRVDYCPQVIFKRCRFVPNFSAVNYNVRGMSLDAGNDEYPEVWDHSGMLIDSCYFRNTGVGFSKGENAVITNNHFVGYRKDVDMIHMEEYTNNILIENNHFDFYTPSRCLYLDREVQPVHDIRIINNLFTGKYHWVFWCYSPYNITFENNDLTGASANDASSRTFDFMNHHLESKEKLPYELPAENIVFRNNTGLNKSNIGMLAYYPLEGDSSLDFQDYPEFKTVTTTLAHRPRSVIDTATLYRIRNSQSGEYMAAQDGSSNLKLIAEEATDSSDIWRIGFKYPYTNTFLNVKTKNYMEVYKGYTLGDYDNPDLPSVYVEQKYSYEGRDALPHFFLRAFTSGDQQVFQIAPGGNEKKSRVIKAGSNVELELAEDKAAGTMRPPTEASTWELLDINFVDTTGSTDTMGTFTPHTITVQKAFRIYPNPVVNTVNIDVKYELPEELFISVISITGRELFSRKFGAKAGSYHIDIPDVPSGLYLLKLRSGAYQEVSKLIMKRE